MHRLRRGTWTNWAGNQACRPAEVVRPSSEGSLRELVARAAEEQRRVKAVGAGHSFTAVACTDGVLVDLDRYDEVLWVDRGARQVCVQAGIPLWRLNEVLARHELALENLGDIAYQSIAGATQTATHGTGARFRNLSAAIVGMRLIDGTGDVVECSAEVEPEVFASARVGIGALGLVSTVTLQCVPAFRLHAIEEPMLVDEVLEGIDELVAANDHFELFWVPNTRWALTKRNHRTAQPPSPRPAWRTFYEDVVLDNWGFRLMLEAGRFRNDWIPRVARRLPSKGRVEYTDRSDLVFASPRLVPFYEMEYGVPREALVEAVQRVRAIVDAGDRYIGFPVEVRTTAADDIPLSTASGRDTAYIAVHVYRRTPYREYFAAVEAAMVDLGGRPHWGKLHTRTAADLAPAYPRWDEFQAVRARLDPEGRFANTYTDRVLGPVRG